MHLLVAQHGRWLGVATVTGEPMSSAVAIADDASGFGTITDLGMAPLALDLMRRALPDRHAADAPRSAIGRGPRLAAAIAALACVATSEEGPSDVVLRPPFLINWTRTTVAFEIAHVTIPCDADGGVQSEELGPTRRVEIERGRAVTIRETQIDEDVLDLEATCGIARLRADGAGTIWVAWSARTANVMGGAANTDATESGELTWEIKPDDDTSFEYGVALGGASSKPTWVIGERLEEGREP